MLCSTTSNYPGEIDDMVFFQDNSLEKIQIIIYYDTLISQGKYTEASAYINQQKEVYGYFADFFNLLENKLYNLQEYLLTKEKKQPFIFYDEEEYLPIDSLQICFMETQMNEYMHEELSTIFVSTDEDELESIENLLVFWEKEKEPPGANIDTIWI